MNSEFSKVRLGIEKQPVIGAVSYDDIVELEQLKNDLYPNNPAVEYKRQ